MSQIDWSLYPNFTEAEFDCKETGENDMRPEALDLFQRVRIRYGRPMTVISGFRSVRHSEEIHKPKPGAHPQGKAGDFSCNNAADRYALVKAAIECGAKGIGIAQSFIHLDSGHDNATRPAIWKY